MRKYLLIIAAIALIIGGVWYVWLRPQASVVTVANTRVPVEIADTEAERVTGLSGREGLEPGHGLWFIYERDDYHGIWMKDMRFAIDIVWVSNEAKVVGLATNVEPNTYPKVFYPGAPARYVLELPSGMITAKNININDPVELSKP